MAQDYTTEILISTAVADVGNCHCCEPAGHSHVTEYSGRYEFVLPRRGVFEIHRGRERAVADPNNLAFFNRGDEYRVSHPGHDGDTCTFISFEENVLREMFEEVGIATGSSDVAILPHTSMPLDRTLIMWHHAMLQSMRQDRPESLAYEECIVSFAGSVLERLARRQNNLKPLVDPVQRAAIDGVKALLAAEPEKNRTLEGLSKRIGYSRYHLCRLFRAETGTSIYRYLLELRIHVALDHIAQGEDDLTALAFDLGFSSHSHFSHIFRSLVGMSPSAFRAQATHAVIQDKRTILKA